MKGFHARLAAWVLGMSLTMTCVYFEAMNRVLLSVQKLPHDHPPKVLEKFSSPRLPSLSELTQDSMSTADSVKICSDQGLMYAHNRIPKSQKQIQDNVNSKKYYNHGIPPIIHQTGKSRCLSPGYYNATLRWQDFYDDQTEWSYYFHDDVAVQRLLQVEFPEFPHLFGIVDSCLGAPGRGVTRSDIWRYLVLYAYGGVYSDMDTTPHRLTSNMLMFEPNHHQAVFAIENWRFLTQYFMAVQPRHPIMYHTIHAALERILNIQDIGDFDASWVTGPKALHHGFVKFLSDGGSIVPPSKDPNGFSRAFRENLIRNGTFYGTGNYSVTVIGHHKNSDEWVWRYAKETKNKKRDYTSMGMTIFGHFKNNVEYRTNISCKEAILRKYNPDTFAGRMQK